MIQQKCGSCYILGTTTQIGKSKVAQIVRLHLLIEAAILSLYFSLQNLESDHFFGLQSLITLTKHHVLSMQCEVIVRKNIQEVCCFLISEKIDPYQTSGEEKWY